jgi:hypothetical protein
VVISRLLAFGFRPHQGAIGTALLLRGERQRSVMSYQPGEGRSVPSARAAARRPWWSSADAYSPLWDAQLGLWTPKAVKEGLNKRQTEENQVLNLAFSRPDLLTGVNPATGQPQLYGSVGVDINCAVIGYTAKAPRTPGPPNLPGSQFPHANPNPLAAAGPNRGPPPPSARGRPDAGCRRISSVANRNEEHGEGEMTGTLFDVIAIGWPVWFRCSRHINAW